MKINKSIYSDAQGNELRLSSIVQMEQKVDFQNFSAKYVISGKEDYTLNNRRLAVNAGEYVIGNKTNTSKVLIDNSEPVKGICIDISKELITEIIGHQFENPHQFYRFLFEQEWVSQKYNNKNTSLGYALDKVANEFENLKEGNSKISKELFYNIGECIVKDQSIVFKNFSQLKAVKEETNGRLFNYVYEAKDYIDNHFLEKINLQIIARQAKVSEYHFIRLFKTAFNTTPYQYILKKKMDFAIKLIETKYLISDISLLLGYNDTAAFSNAFKQHFGFSPKKLK